MKDFFFPTTSSSYHVTVVNGYCTHFRSKNPELYSNSEINEIIYLKNKNK